MTIQKYRAEKPFKKTRQLLLSKSQFQISDSYGGSLRNRRRGRKFRPLSKKEPLHLVFKACKFRLKEKSFRGLRTFQIVQKLIRRYSQRFHIKIEHFSIQNDHLHLLVRSSQRFFFQAFFRVLAGQIAQRLQKEGLLCLVTDTPETSKAKTGLWKYRPFSRVVRGLRSYSIVQDYIQLNEKEVRGLIRYSSRRLAGLSSGEWKILWEY